MDGATYWITPLALLPGVALLVMSTAIRFGQLHEELHRRVHDSDHALGAAGHLFVRARLLRNALVSLYASAALLALSGMVGGVAEIWMEHAAAVVLGVTALAVACVAYASITLIRESLQLSQVIEDHRASLERDA